MIHALYLPLLTITTTVACFVAACLISLSYVSTKSLHAASSVPETVILTQWRSVFNLGFHLCPMPSIAASVLCFINAGLARWAGQTGVPTMLVTQGVLLIGIVPFTLAFIVGPEDEILKKETRLRQAQLESKEKVTVEDSEQTRQSHLETIELMSKWDRRNYCRVCLPVLAAGVGWRLWWKLVSDTIV